MRICLIGPTYPYRGGIAQHTTLLAKQLRQDEAIDLLLISFSKQYPRWLFPGKTDIDPTEMPVQTDAEYLLNPLNPLSWWRTWRRVVRWQPDTVLFAWWHPFFAPAWATLTRTIRASRPAAKLLAICHNVMPHEDGTGWRKTVIRWLVKMTLAGFDGYILHSEREADILRELIPQAEVVVTPMPTYAEIGAGNTAVPKNTLPLKPNIPLLLFCGFVRPYKGLDVLIDALPLVLEQQPVQLLVVGEFWRDSYAETVQQLERLDLTAHVTILNEYVTDDLLAFYVQQADAVVLPYRSATQSAVVQLAFGHNKPVITTNVGGLGEVVTHYKTGLVVPPDDPSLLAQAIRTYFEQGLKSEFQENIAGEYGRFSWAHFQKAIINFDRTAQ